MNVTAVEDTLCYLIPREPFLALLERRPEIHDFFTQAFITTYLDKAFSDGRATSLGLGDSERLLFTTTVGELPTREPVTAPPGSRSGTPPGSCRATGSARWCSPTPRALPSASSPTATCATRWPRSPGTAPSPSGTS